MGSSASSGLLRLAVGANNRKPSELDCKNNAMRDLLHRVFHGLDESRIVDVHCHLLGVGTGPSNSGCFVHPSTLQPCCSPVNYFKIKAMKIASGVLKHPDPDVAYVQRLRDQVLQCGPVERKGNIRCMLLAFDQVYGEDGEAKLSKTSFYVPNDYSIAVARAYPNEFIATCSL